MHTDIRYESRYFLSFGWGLVFALCALSVVLVLARQGYTERYYTNNFNDQLIDRFVEVKKDTDLSVAMLGNCRLRNATTFGFMPDKIVELEDGRTMAALMFAYNAARFDMYADLAQRLLDAKPDILVIQDAVLTNTLPTTHDFMTYPKIAFDYLNSLVGGVSLHEQWLQDRLLVYQNCYEIFTYSNLKKLIHFIRLWSSHVFSPHNENHKASQDFVKQALEQGTTVLVLSLPGSEEVVSQFGVPMHKIDFYGIGHYPSRQELLPEVHNDVVWYDYQSNAGRAHYCDYLHLNEAGRTRFNVQFIEELQRLKPKASF